jgi:hypothetical protein
MAKKYLYYKCREVKMGLLDDLGFHFKNYISYKTRDSIVGEFMRTHLKNDIMNNDRISDATKSKVGKDLNHEDLRQFIRDLDKEK